MHRMVLLLGKNKLGFRSDRSELRGLILHRARLPRYTYSIPNRHSLRPCILLVLCEKVVSQLLAGRKGRRLVSVFQTVDFPRTEGIVRELELGLEAQ